LIGYKKRVEIFTDDGVVDAALKELITAQNSKNNRKKRREKAVKFKLPNGKFRAGGIVSARLRSKFGDIILICFYQK